MSAFYSYILITYFLRLLQKQHSYIRL